MRHVYRKKNSSGLECAIYITVWSLENTKEEEGGGVEGEKKRKRANTGRTRPVFCHRVLAAVPLGGILQAEAF